MKIAVVIVTYNGIKLLEKCLLSIKNQASHELSIIVVDNGSTDGTKLMIRNRFSDIEFIELGFNSGFCRANNIGIAYGLKIGCDGFVLLNNDTELVPLFFDEIKRTVRASEGIGMIATKVLFLNKPDFIDSAGLSITSDGLSINNFSGQHKSKGNTKKEVFCPCGSAAYYSKELLLDACRDGQFFDEDYQYYYEELDLGWRARLKGWKCIYNPKAIVYHHKSATAGAYSEFIAYHTNKNIFFNIIKNYPSKYLVLKALILSILRYLFLFIASFFNIGIGSKIRSRIGFFNMIDAFLKSLVDQVKYLPRMLRKRKIIQNEKMVCKKEIHRWFKELGSNFFNSLYKF